MLMLDVNVIIYAFWTGHELHIEIREWLLQQAKCQRPILIPAIVLSGFIRIVTAGKAVVVPEPLNETLSFCDSLLSIPQVRLAHPGESHWSLFTDLCRKANATGNLVPDAFLAAMAIERGAEFITMDRDFNQFPGLSWRHPLDELPFTNPR